MSVSRVRRNAILLGILLNRQMYKWIDVVSTQSVIFYLIKSASIINTSFEYDHRFSQNSKAADLFSVDLHACSYVASVHTKIPYVTHHKTLLLVSLVITTTSITEHGSEASVGLNEHWPF